MTAGAAARRIAIVAAAAFALDQLSKWLVIEGLGLAERLRIDVIPGLIAFKMAWNRGVNFGLLASHAEAARWLLTGVALAVSVAVAAWALRRREGWFALGAGLVIGGALGNALDRARHGAVADFLNVTCCGVANPYAFNVADVAIFAGAAAILFAPSAAAEENRGDRA